jgi:hypothetical protein
MKMDWNEFLKTFGEKEIELSKEDGDKFWERINNIRNNIPDDILIDFQNAFGEFLEITTENFRLQPTPEGTDRETFKKDYLGYVQLFLELRHGLMQLKRNENE